MNFLIIGFGSIGKRHLNNLIDLGYQNISIVTKSEINNEKWKSFTIYPSLEDALAENKISHAFICTPTANHFEHLKIVLEHEIQHIYLEKPISNNLNQIEDILVLRNKCQRLVVGYDLHFDPGLYKIKTFLNQNQLGKILSINAVVGQYLPDWRPDQDYRKGMSASVEKGGGVMLDLIHEFDYIQWLVGKPKWVACIVQHNPLLEIETEDIANVLVQFENNASGMIHLDYHQKKLVRNCMITCEKGTIFWDIVTAQVRIVNQDKQEEIFSYPDFERNQRYVEIVKAFLDTSIFDSRLTTFEEGLLSLKMVLAAKQASITNTLQTIN